METFENINLNFLKTFAFAAQILNFTKTAEVLCMTQSGVSQHIASLEKELKTTLFHRAGRKITLTESGKHLLSFISSMQGEFEQLRDRLVAEREDLQGRVYIGVPGSVNYLLSRFIMTTIKKDMPKVNIGIIINSDAGIFQSLQNNEMDIGFTTVPMMEKGFISKEVIKEEITLIGDETTKPIQNIDDLLKRTFVFHPGFVNYYQYWFSKVFPKMPYTSPEKGVYMNNYDNIIQAVSCGLGISILPVKCKTEAIQNKKIKKIWIKNEKVEQPVYISHRNIVPFAVKEMIQVSISYLESLHDAC